MSVRTINPIPVKPGLVLPRRRLYTIHNDTDDGSREARPRPLIVQFNQKNHNIKSAIASFTTQRDAWRMAMLMQSHKQYTNTWPALDYETLLASHTAIDTSRLEFTELSIFSWDQTDLTMYCRDNIFDLLIVSEAPNVDKYSLKFTGTLRRLKSTPQQVIDKLKRSYIKNEDVLTDYDSI